jgi:hypothetical protein
MDKVTCPHCGDVTLQDHPLERYTCEECDEPFDAAAATSSAADLYSAVWTAMQDLGAAIRDLKQCGHSIPAKLQALDIALEAAQDRVEALAMDDGEANGE